MTKTIHRELVVPQARERVWRALTESATLAEWMFPNDFQPRLGHRFTFRVPPKPEVDFEGLTVDCEVLACDAPERLEFSWEAAGLTGTRVSFRLEAVAEGTRILFEHSGFDVSVPWGEQAYQGATYGWAKMFKDLTAVMDRPDLSVCTSRALPATPERVFAAFQNPEELARWWGPAGFTNTFEVFEFHPEGRWIFTMHGPDGSDYANECIFRELVSGIRLVIEHVVTPWFRLTVTLLPRGEGETHLTWVQQFEGPEMAAKMRPLGTRANEEVLDRLTDVLTDGK